MKIKYYFEDSESEFCHTLAYFKEKWKSEMNQTVELYEAEYDGLGSDLFWCKEFSEFNETGEGICGKQCEKYEPCNGKNGKCRHYSKDSYIHGKKISFEF